MRTVILLTTIALLIVGYTLGTVAHRTIAPITAYSHALEQALK